MKHLPYMLLFTFMHDWLGISEEHESVESTSLVKKLIHLRPPTQSIDHSLLEGLLIRHFILKVVCLSPLQT